MSLKKLEKDIQENGAKNIGALIDLCKEFIAMADEMKKAGKLTDSQYDEVVLSKRKFILDMEFAGKVGSR